MPRRRRQVAEAASPIPQIPAEINNQKPVVTWGSIDLLGNKHIILSCGHELGGDSLPISDKPIVGKAMSCRKCNKS